MSLLLLSTCWISKVDHSGPFLFSKLFCGTPPSCLKVLIIESATVPFGPLWALLGLELGWTGLGLGLGGLGTKGLGTRA